MIQMEKKVLKRLIVWPLLIALCATIIFSGMSMPAIIASAAASEYNEVSELYDLGSISGTSLPSGVTEFGISSAAGIQKFANLVNNSGISFAGKTIYLTNDIDDMLAKATADGIGYQFAIGTNTHPFKGVFDGCGFTVGLIDIRVSLGDYGGFFGVTNGAIIKNLVIGNGKGYGTIQNENTFPYFGAIVGNATDTVIINSVNKADITNLTSGGSNIAAGIVAFGEGNTIINCFNYGKIATDNSAGIVPSDVAKVSLCINLGTFADKMGGTYTGADIEDDEVDVWSGWTSMVDSQKETKVTDFNTDIHLKRSELREVEEEQRLFLFYWGFDAEDNDYLVLCLPKTYTYYLIQKGVIDEADVQSKEIPMPLLKANIMSEFLSKNAAAVFITIWFRDTYAYVTGTSESSITVRADIQEKYFDILKNLEDESVDDIESTAAIFSFAKGIEDFIKNACAEMDDIFFEWAGEYEGEFVDAIREFAIGIITNWFNDCTSFVVGDDAAAVTAREKLLKVYEERIAGLEDIEYSDSNELLIKISEYINMSLNLLDDEYYNWELGVSRSALNEAYNKALEWATGDNREKVKKIKADAESKIVEAKALFEQTQDYDEERINRWIEYTGTVDDIVTDAIAQMNDLELQWNRYRTTIIWSSVSGGILLIAGAVVIALLVAMKKKDKNYKAIIVEIQDDRKSKKIWQKADSITRESEARREKEEQRAEANRLKAEQILREYREKMEKAEQVNSAQSSSQAEIRNEKLEQMEQARREKLEQMAAAHREKALAAKKKKK